MDEKIKNGLRLELLNLAENVTEDTVNSVFKMAELAIQLSENKIDDAILPVLPPVKDFIMGFVDKIDGVAE